jgi:hypothetical protein
MIKVDWSHYPAKNHSKVRRLVRELSELVAPCADANGNLPTTGMVPPHIAERSQQIFNELSGLAYIN